MTSKQKDTNRKHRKNQDRMKNLMRAGQAKAKN